MLHHLSLVPTHRYVAPLVSALSPLCCTSRQCPLTAMLHHLLLVPSHCSVAPIVISAHSSLCCTSRQCPLTAMLHHLSAVWSTHSSRYSREMPKYRTVALENTFNSVTYTSFMYLKFNNSFASILSRLEKVWGHNFNTCQSFDWHVLNL